MILGKVKYPRRRSGMEVCGNGEESMDFFSGRTPMRRSKYGSVTGTIVDLVPMRIGNRRADGCMLFVTLENTDGNTVNFIMTPATYVVDFETLSVGMLCTFWYEADAPMPLIYPPQYNAVVAAQVKNERMVNVGYYNTSLVNDEPDPAVKYGRLGGCKNHKQPVFSGKPRKSQSGGDLYEFNKKYSSPDNAGRGSCSV